MALLYNLSIFSPEPADFEIKRFEYFTTIVECLVKNLKHTGYLFSCQWKNVPLDQGNGKISNKRFHFLFNLIICRENYVNLVKDKMMHPKCWVIWFCWPKKLQNLWWVIIETNVTFQIEATELFPWVNLDQFHRL